MSEYEELREKIAGKLGWFFSSNRGDALNITDEILSIIADKFKVGWRPANWENPYFKEDASSSWNEYPEFAVFEAGADAILKGLKEIKKGE